MKATHALLGLLVATLATTARAERRVEERIASNHANGKIEIDIGEGSVEVIGWDKNEVEVTGTIGDRVERLDVKQGRRKVWVRAYVPKEGDAREAKLIIRAPHNNDIDAQVFQGPISITGIEGDIQLETFSGNVTVAGPSKRVEARTVNGDITIDAAAGAVGVDKARLKTVTGAVVVRKARREVEVQSISGAVTVTCNSLNKVLIETVSGNVSFDGGLSRLGRLEIDTHDGDIVGMFPADLLAEFDITSFNGQVENAFNPNASNNQDFIQGEGDPQAEIKATSFSGDIRVTKQSKVARGGSAQSGELPRKRQL